MVEFEEYVSDEQFAIVASDLARRAAQEAQRLMDTITSVTAVADALLSVMKMLSERDRTSWPAYHAGIAAGLDGRSAVAAEILGRIAVGAKSTDSVLHPAAERMARRVHDPAGFQQEAASLVARQRRAVGLAALDARPF